MIFSNIVTVSLLLLATPRTFARSSSSPSSSRIQVYLHPTPPKADLSNSHSHSHSHHQNADAPTLTPSQAKSVFDHHLGQAVSEHATVDVIQDDADSWLHLIGTDLWGGKDEGKRPKVIVIDGGVSPQEILPSSMSAPAFYIPQESAAHALLAPYLKQAKHLLDHILDAVPSLRKGFKDVFELAGTKASEVLSQEISCLIALADSIPWTHTSKWDALKISGLKGVDRDSELWEAGRSSIQAGLESMTTPGSPPLLLVIMPQQQNLHSRSFTERANSTSASCYSSNSTCSESTDCYGHGSCALRSNVSGKECWACKCTSGFAGVECQKEDYTIPFVILIFTTVLLLAIAIGSIALLSSVGETKLPSTLTLAVGPNLKRD